MVRASIVSHIFGEISDSKKEKVGFEFEREVIVGVPAGTDAGFVVREGLPEMNGANKDREFSEPAFSVLYPQRLNKLAGRKSDPLKWIVDNLFAPMARVAAYLLMEQGIIGENHSQNFDYVVDKEGQPLDRVVLRDADAHRVNLTLRALNGESLAGAQLIDNPFFYLMEAAFKATQVADGSAMNLNALMGYMLDSHQYSTFVTAIHDWCYDIARFKTWCDRRTIRTALLSKMAEYLSAHLDRDVSPNEIKFDRSHYGNLGFMPLFQERMRQLEDKAYQKDLEFYLQEQQDQKALKAYFDKMDKQSRVRYNHKDKLSLRDHFFVFIDTPGAEHIRAYRKNANTLRSSAFVGIAIPDLRDEVGYRRFRKSINTCAALLTQTPPLMNSMGDGSGVR